MAPSTMGLVGKSSLLHCTVSTVLWCCDCAAAVGHTRSEPTSASTTAEKCAPGMSSRFPFGVVADWTWRDAATSSTKTKIRAVTATRTSSLGEDVPGFGRFRPSFERFAVYGARECLTSQTLVL